MGIRYGHRPTPTTRRYRFTMYAMIVLALVVLIVLTQVGWVTT